MNAKVIRYAGDGAQTLREAIESGMLAVDAERACRATAEENEALKREVARLRRALAIEEAINARERGILIEAIGRHLREGKHHDGGRA